MGVHGPLRIAKADEEEDDNQKVRREDVLNIGVCWLVDFLSFGNYKVPVDASVLEAELQL